MCKDTSLSHDFAQVSIETWTTRYSSWPHSSSLFTTAFTSLSIVVLDISSSSPFRSLCSRSLVSAKVSLPNFYGFHGGFLLFRGTASDNWPDGKLWYLPLCLSKLCISLWPPFKELRNSDSVSQSIWSGDGHYLARQVCFMWPWIKLLSTVPNNSQMWGPDRTSRQGGGVRIGLWFRNIEGNIKQWR